MVPGKVQKKVKKFGWLINVAVLGRPLYIGNEEFVDVIKMFQKNLDFH